MATKIFWPGPDERRLLSRFYLSDGLSRALYLVYPFEFAYLYLVMDRPEWAVLPLMAMSATSLVMQLPTGALADRWGRKLSVLAGGALTSVTYVAVPWASRLSGTAQLLAVCGAFAVTGLGQTMMTGAQEAWVVDNLKAVGREDLVEPFFARVYAVISVGGAIAATAAVLVLVLLRVDRFLLDSLWYATAAGFIAAVGVALGIPEIRPDSDPVGEQELFPRMKAAIQSLIRTRPLLFLTLALFIANLSGSGADEAFPAALIGTGIDARALGPVTIAEDLFGVAAPLLAMMLARRFGVERLLSRSLLFCGAAVVLLFVWHSAPVIIGLWVVLGFVDRMWDPTAMARLQDDIPSEHRAAIGSLVYQANGVAELAGLGLLALLLGSHSSQLRDATPDLIDAFTHHGSTGGAVPEGLFKLPIPDLAILILVVLSLMAVPFVLLHGRSRRGMSSRHSAGEGRPEGDKDRSPLHQRPPAPQT